MKKINFSKKLTVAFALGIFLGVITVLIVYHLPQPLPPTEPHFVEFDETLDVSVIFAEVVEIDGKRFLEHDVELIPISDEPAQVISSRRVGQHTIMNASTNEFIRLWSNNNILNRNRTIRPVAFGPGITGATVFITAPHNLTAITSPTLTLHSSPFRYSIPWNAGHYSIYVRSHTNGGAMTFDIQDQ
ncbi:MAG: hypothetical protein FWF57_00350 [Defluviitaleaceae bacterium]|nr:hypothetical protein [Defluviitaleaceae bacterium]